MSEAARDRFRRLAVLDNAALCVAIWRAHGLEVHRRDGLVMCSGHPPKFYPNAIAVDAMADPEAQSLALARLAAESGARGVSVKDGFQRLDLTPHGYTRLFEAEWIHRAPGSTVSPALDWRLVETADDLAAWEAAWRGRGEASQAIFKSSLLADESLGIFAGWRGEAIVAGVVLTPTDTVVGVSNVFGDHAEAVAIAGQVFPGRDLVGYERDERLQAARTLGFEPVGGLTVWSHP